MKEKEILTLLVFAFLAFYFMPVGAGWFEGSLSSAFALLHDYAVLHVLTCLVPAMFIAGAIAVFVGKESIVKYLGAGTKKYVSYTIASVSGAILTVCSCTVLPLFASIRERGAGIGPAITFLFSGPAINVAAMTLTISILGPGIGFARITGSIALSILIGLTMAFIFREKAKRGKVMKFRAKKAEVSKKNIALLFISLVGILVINGIQADFMVKYALMGILALIAAGVTLLGMEKNVSERFALSTWSFAKRLVPLLFIGVFVAGFVMPLIPDGFIQAVVGENTVQGNLAASVFGAFMYFSTLTEIPIVQALIAKGMDSGPALALLLSGPSLSLPSMLVIRGFLGSKKTAAYVLLVILYSSAAGLLFGLVF